MPSVLGERATVRVIHVLRKPLSEGTVAANVVKHGCGGLNIDASRVSGIGDHMRPYPPTNNDREVYGAQAGFQPTNHKGRRWPANLILQHLDGCRCDGVKKVSKGGGSGVASRNHEHQAGFLEGKDTGGFNTSHYGSDGKESVANWICEPGCPVARLDGQSGTTTSTGGNHSGHNAFGQDSGWNPHQNRPTTIHRVGDKGGASRFFKQIGGAE